MTQPLPKTVSSQRFNSPSRASTSPEPIGGHSPGEYFSRLKQRPDQLYPLLALIALVTLLVVAYWDSLQLAYRIWRTDPLYSFGFIVPVFSIVLLMMRRKPFSIVEMTERWAGVGFILLGLGIRYYAAIQHTTTLDSPTLVICLLGAFLLAGGWSMLRWAGPPIAFLLFMYPVPIVVKDMVMLKLQSVATLTSTFLLQTLGMLAFRSGNRIEIFDNVIASTGEVTVEPIALSVIGACSGLRMLTIFIAMAVAIVMVTDRPWWDRLIILLSAVPIAVLVNVIRIMIIAFLFKWAGDQEWVKYFSHDGAGLVMMPMALGFMYLELQILSHLVIEDEDVSAVNVGGHGAHAPVTA